MPNSLVVSLVSAFLLLKSLSLGESVQVLVTYLVNGILLFIVCKLPEGKAKSDGSTLPGPPFLVCQDLGHPQGSQIFISFRRTETSVLPTSLVL